MSCFERALLRSLTLSLSFLHLPSSCLLPHLVCLCLRYVHRRNKSLFQILEGTSALQEAKLKEAIEEEKGKVKDLEAQVKQLAQVCRSAYMIPLLTFKHLINIYSMLLFLWKV